MKVLGAPDPIKWVGYANAGPVSANEPSYERSNILRFWNRLDNGQGGEVAQLMIRTGRTYMVTSPERAAALGELRYSIGKVGVDVDLEITKYEPGRRGFPPQSFPEGVAIFIGTSVDSGLIGAIVTDVYNKAK